MKLGLVVIVVVVVVVVVVEEVGVGAAEALGLKGLSLEVPHAVLEANADAAAVLEAAAEKPVSKAASGTCCESVKLIHSVLSARLKLRSSRRAFSCLGCFEPRSWQSKAAQLKAEAGGPSSGCLGIEP